MCIADPLTGWFLIREVATSQILKLTQHIEYEYKNELVTGAVFVDFHANRNTINHWLQLKNITGDHCLTTINASNAGK